MKLMPAVTRDIADKATPSLNTSMSSLLAMPRSRSPTLLLASSLAPRRRRAHQPVRKRVDRVPLPRRNASRTSSFRPAAPARIGVVPAPRRATLLHQRKPENLSRQIERNAKEVPKPGRPGTPSTGSLASSIPTGKIAYRDVQVLPKLDELKLGEPRAHADRHQARWQSAAQRIAGASSTTSRRRTICWC